MNYARFRTGNPAMETKPSRTQTRLPNGTEAVSHDGRHFVKPGECKQPIRYIRLKGDQYLRVDQSPDAVGMRTSKVTDAHMAMVWEERLFG